jgi:hypothetical protein
MDWIGFGFLENAFGVRNLKAFRRNQASRIELVRHQGNVVGEKFLIKIIAFAVVPQNRPTSGMGADGDIHVLVHRRKALDEQLVSQEMDFVPCNNNVPAGSIADIR